MERVAAAGTDCSASVGSSEEEPPCPGLDEELSLVLEPEGRKELVCHPPEETPWEEEPGSSAQEGACLVKE